MLTTTRDVNEHRKNVLEELSRILHIAVSTSDAKTTRKDRTGVEREFAAPVELNDEEKEAIQQLVIANADWIVKVCSGNLPLLDVPAEGRAALEAIKMKRKELNELEEAFGKQFPSLRENRKYNDAAVNVTSVAFDTIKGKKVPTSILADTGVFLGTPDNGESETEA